MNKIVGELRYKVQVKAELQYLADNYFAITPMNL